MENNDNDALNYQLSILHYQLSITCFDIPAHSRR